MSYQTGMFEKTLQDLRNEIQQMSFKEITKMQITGDTSVCNFINRLLNKMDYEYGTEYEKQEENQ